MSFTISEREATRIELNDSATNLSVAFSSYVYRTTRPDENRCVSPGTSRSLPAQQGWLRTEIVWKCSAPPDRLTVESFFELAAEHTHYATYTMAGNVRQEILSGDRMVWSLISDVQSEQIQSRWREFFVSGFRHVSTGVDHLVFLFALVLVFTRKRDIVFAVSGFTLGHSLALAAITFDAVVVNQGAVESLIGLTVCLLCVEYLMERNPSYSYAALLAVIGIFVLMKFSVPSVLGWGLLLGLTLIALGYLELVRTTGKPQYVRIVLTLFFGLIHGAGFASGFIASDISPGTLWPAVIGFNLGVEAGQLAFIALVLLVLKILTPRIRTVSQDIAITVFFGVGVYWFFARGFSTYY